MPLNRADQYWYSYVYNECIKSSTHFCLVVFSICSSVFLPASISSLFWRHSSRHMLLTLPAIAKWIFYSQSRSSRLFFQFKLLLFCKTYLYSPISWSSVPFFSFQLHCLSIFLLPAMLCLFWCHRLKEIFLFLAFITKSGFFPQFRINDLICYSISFHYTSANARKRHHSLAMKLPLIVFDISRLRYPNKSSLIALFGAGSAWMYYIRKGRLMPALWYIWTNLFGINIRHCSVT